MKLSKSFLVLVTVCCAHVGYSMENTEKQIVEDLIEARALLITAEYRINEMGILVNNFNNSAYKESLLRETIEWTSQADGFSQKIMNDDLASAKAKKEAQLCIDRGSEIRQKLMILSKKDT